MKTKRSMRYMNAMYGVGKTETQTILLGLLSSDQLDVFVKRFKNLDQLAEAKETDILSIPGLNISDATVKEIKSTMDAFYDQFEKWELLTGMPGNVVPMERVKYGKLIEASYAFGTSINEMKKAINKLSNVERKFIRLKFGINKDGKEYPYVKISEKLEIPVSELDEFEVKALNNLTEIIMSSR